MHLPDVAFWRAPAGDQHVAYWSGRYVWLAAGPPVAEPAQQAAAARSFVQAAAAHGRRAAFFAMPEEIACAAGLRWVAIGTEPICWRSRWMSPGANQRASFRRQVRRAQRTVSVQACTFASVAPHADAVVRAWQARQAMPPLHFLASVRWRAEPGARLWAARSRRGVEAVATVVGAGERATYLVEHIVRRPDAPNGTAEALIDAVMREMEPAERVSLGFVALSGPVPPALRLAGHVGHTLYSFAGLAAFRRRLQPDESCALGLAYPSRGDAPWAAWAVAMAFVGSRPASFAARLVLRGPPLLLWAQSIALVPWTLALALAPTSPWFVHPGTQRAWVAFDSILAVALGSLAWRPRYRLAATLTAIVMFDVMLTCAEAYWAAPVDGLCQRLIRTTMVLAPALSACVLWRTARRLVQAYR